MSPGLPLCALSLQICQDHSIYLYQDLVGYLLLEAGLFRPQCAVCFLNPVFVLLRTKSAIRVLQRMEPDITMTTLPRCPFDTAPHSELG